MLGDLKLKGDLLVAFLLAVIYICTVVHSIFARLLRRKVEPNSPARAELFNFTSPYLANGRRVAALKPKFVFPWVASPDISDCPSPAKLYLQICRYSAFLAVACLVGVIIACLSR